MELPLQERLVRAGVELLEEDGLANLGLRAITRRAGVSHGAPRRYFPTHTALLAAIARTGLADLAERLGAPPANPGAAPDQRLLEVCERYLAFAAERPEMFALIFRHDLLEDAGGNLRETSVPLFEAFVAVVAAVQPADARQRTLALWTNVHGLAVLTATRTLDLIPPGDGFLRRIVTAHLQ